MEHQLDDLIQKSIEVILSRLDGGKLSKSDKDVDFALRGLAAASRLRATERAKDATQFAVLKMLARSPEEFHNYAKTALPHLTPTKLLPRPQK